MECPSGSYCPSGSTKPKSCAMLYDSSTGQSVCASQCSVARRCIWRAFSSTYLQQSCDATAWFYTLIALAVVVVLAIVGVGAAAVVAYVRKKRAAMDEPKKERLIPEPLGGPVYGGY